MYKQFNPCITQLEVAHDFFSKDDTDDVVYDLYTFFDHHLCMKYARAGSVGHYEEKTSYRGPDGNTRRGKGSKCYIKELPFNGGTRTACRLEPQLNGKAVRDRKITVSDLPLDPRSLNALNYLEVRDNISFHGIKNLSRSISRQKEIPYTRDAKNRMRTTVIANILKRKISTAWLDDDCFQLSVPEQIDRFKFEVDRYGLIINPKKYCQPLFNLSETVACLLDSQATSNCRQN